MFNTALNFRELKQGSPSERSDLSSGGRLQKFSNITKKFSRGYSDKLKILDKIESKNQFVMAEPLDLKALEEKY